MPETLVAPPVISGEEFEREVENVRRLLRREASVLRANRHLNDHFAQVWEAIAELGTAYPPRPLPEGYEFGPPDLCLSNALDCATAHGIAYVEGVAYQPPRKGLTTDREFYPGRPVLSGLFRHAWAVDAAGEVVDTTYGFLGPRAVYLGLSVPLGDAATMYPTPTTNTVLSSLIRFVEATR